MILFSPAKINIGLQIIERRGDGFHNLQSIMYPVGLCDILEIRRSPDGGESMRFSQSGIQIDSPNNKNLCIKAWELFTKELSLPAVDLHLHKQIPVGAGLGGGSSNASVTLKGLNRLVGNPLPLEMLHELAATLGSDCPFFLQENPMMMEGRGDILSSVSLCLDHLYLVLLFPEVHISTAEAYAGVIPAVHDGHLREVIREPMDRWKELVINDFEYSIFDRHPEIDQLKQDLYRAGALYASLSGSGSSLYGIFPESPDLPENLERYVIWRGAAVSGDETS
ncbi:MAG: 4-(cytidine 5'-diphospho)-2-C-methyl-D-erythritol kinase [Bacteroidota bacterium]